MKTKSFDCVEMKRQAALEIYEETKSLSVEEKIKYWSRKNEEALRRHALRKQTERGGAPAN